LNSHCSRSQCWNIIYKPQRLSRAGWLCPAKLQSRCNADLPFLQVR
jgi:hypothetical protein